MCGDILHDPASDELLRDLLPADYDYKIKKCEVKDQSEDNLKFNLEIRVSVKTEGEVKLFLASMNKSTGCTFNIQMGRQDKRQNLKNKENLDRSLSQLRGYRKCCMNVDKSGERPDRQPGKNTDCKASINFRLENTIGKDKQAKEEREKYPLWMKVNFVHNHSLNRAEYFKFLSVSGETKQHYMEMFEQGVLPGSAHTQRKRFIKAEFPNTWPKQFADRSLLPSIFWVYKCHRLFMDKTVGSRDGLDAYERAEELVRKFDDECKLSHPLPGTQCYAKIAQSLDGETAVVIVDPFMQRVHQTIPQSGDIVMIDATSNLDRNDSKLIHIVCPSPIGALPLADIIVTREDIGTLEFAFGLLKSVLPEKAFFGRGVDTGPQVIMTDDCDGERAALAGTWPDSVQLLCIFHVLQAMWTWLWDSKHMIENKDRQLLLIKFRAVLYAASKSELSECLEELYADETVNKYPQFIKHLIRDTLPKMKSWSLERRITDRLPTGNNNTNNLVESSFRYVKDIQFNRIRAFNLTDMMSLVMDRSEWYVNKVIDAANNRIEMWLKNCHSKYVMKMPNIDPDKITQLRPQNHTYLVPSETDADVSYVVDMEARLCSCPQGRLTGPCKHKDIVAKSKNIPSFDIIPTNSPKMRQLYMFLGTGQQTSLDWFLPLQAEGGQDEEPQPGGGGSHEDEPVEANGADIQPDVGTELINGTSEVSHEDVKAKLKQTLGALADKIMRRIEHDPVGYSKAVNIFGKSVEKLPYSVDSALQKSLCSFGKTITQVNIYLIICNMIAPSYFRLPSIKGNGWASYLCKALQCPGDCTR